jgi:hypothetical protein
MVKTLGVSSRSIRPSTPLRDVPGLREAWREFSAAADFDLPYPPSRELRETGSRLTGWGCQAAFAAITIAAVAGSFLPLLALPVIPGVVWLLSRFVRAPLAAPESFTVGELARRVMAEEPERAPETVDGVGPGPIWLRVKRIVHEASGRDYRHIVPDALLKDDLGIGVVRWWVMDELEATFGVSLSGETFITGETLDDLQQHVCDRLGVETEREPRQCPSERAFLRLRTAIVDALDVSPYEIRPSTRLQDVPGLNRAWDGVAERSGLTLPPVGQELPCYLYLFSGLFLFITLSVALLLSLMWPPFGWSLLVLPFAFLWLQDRVKALIGAFPAGINTMGDLAERALADNVHEFPGLLESPLRDAHPTGPCPTSWTFYRLRRGLMDALSVGKRDIAPDTELVPLLPKDTPVEAWGSVQEASGLNLPPILGRGPAGAGESCLFMIWMLGALISLFGFIFPPPLCYAPLAMLMIATPGVIYLRDRLREREVPKVAGCRTMRDLVYMAMGANPQTVAGAVGGYRTVQITAAVRTAVGNAFGAEPEWLTPETRLDDLDYLDL